MHGVSDSEIVSSKSAPNSDIDLSPETLNYNEEISYDQKVKQGYSIFAYLYNQLKKSTFEINILEEKIEKYDIVMYEIKLESKNHKRLKRLAKNVSRNYICTHKNCAKEYETEASLNQHICKKHKVGLKNQRLKYAFHAFEALKAGKS